MGFVRAAEQPSERRQLQIAQELLAEVEGVSWHHRHVRRALLVALGLDIKEAASRAIMLHAVGAQNIEDLGEFHSRRVDHE
ncbi:hypothetical protein D3C71_1578990 [compost metagenome]